MPKITRKIAIPSKNNMNSFVDIDGTALAAFVKP